MKITIGERNPVNFSDHVEVSLHTTTSYDAKNSAHNPRDTNKTGVQLKQKIRWEKCDNLYYSELLQCGFSRLCYQLPNTQFEMDLVVSSLNTVLYEASASSAPRPSAGRSIGKQNSSLWNEEIATVVERSKRAYKEWRDAGSPDSPDNHLVKNRKQDRRLMRKTIYQQVYIGNQNKYQELATEIRRPSIRQ